MLLFDIPKIRQLELFNFIHKLVNRFKWMANIVNLKDRLKQWWVHLAIVTIIHNVLCILMAIGCQTTPT